MEALINQWQSELENDQAMSNHMLEIMENLQQEVEPFEPHESYNFPFQSSMGGHLRESKWKAAAGTSKDSSSPCVISFGGPELSDEDHETQALKRPNACNHEHVVAERRRRERINQLFIQLSGLIPGLKKTAKSSLLEEAFNYVKHLEAKLRIFEDEIPIIESVSNSHSCSDESLLVINGRSSEKKISLKIHCKTCKNVLVKFLSEIENLHLTITNANLTPFSDSSLDITVIAQAEEGFSMTVKELVEKLDSTFRQLI